MKQELKKLIDKLAESKKDGVYRKSGVTYAVRNGNVIFLSEGSEVYQMASGFMVFIGKKNYRYEAIDELKRLYKLERAN